MQGRVQSELNPGDPASNRTLEYSVQALRPDGLSKQESQRNGKPVERDDHQIHDGAFNGQRPPQRVHPTGELSKRPFQADAADGVDPGDAHSSPRSETATDPTNIVIV